MAAHLTDEMIRELREDYHAVDPEEIKNREGIFDGKATEEDIKYTFASMAKQVLEQAGILLKED